tara:strand:+ start:1846 stop:2262 length:417 start_codon:yes stop_codon:yes gene_type:complete
MNVQTLRARLNDSRMFDWSFNSSATTENGMKISMQGKSVEDSIFLFEKLSGYLYANNIPFKVATAKRFELDSEQGRKAMTIYCVDGFDFAQLCEDVYGLTMDYKGWQDIKIPTSYSHYAGGLFVRNDRDANGVYIPAN